MHASLSHDAALDPLGGGLFAAGGRMHIQHVLWIFLVLFEAILYYRIPLYNWIVSCAALAWLFHRAGAVLKTPVDELVKILGIDVPGQPEVSLSEIRHTGFAIHWKLPEQRATIDKYVVQVNGIAIGEVSSQDCAAVVSGLHPCRYYIVRVLAINSSNFQASSNVIRLKTGGGERDEVNLEASAELEDTSEYRGNDSHPIIQAFKPYQETFIITPSAPAMTREPSIPQQWKRGATAKRGSNNVADQAVLPPATSEQGQATETMPQLSEKLENLGRALTDAKRQEAEDEEEHSHYQHLLLEKKDSLRDQLRIKDDESRELRRTVQYLERQNTQIQSRKATQERMLQHKLSERQKMRDDIKKQDEDVLAIHELIKSKDAESQKYWDDAIKHVQEIRFQQNEISQTTRVIEEDIRHKGNQIKDLEDEKSSLTSEKNDADIHSRHLREAEEDRTWRESLQQLQATYHIMSQEVDRAELWNKQLTHQLDMLRSQSNLLPSAFPAEGHGIGHESPQSRYGHLNRTIITASPNVSSQPIVGSDQRSPIGSMNARDAQGTNNLYTSNSFPFHGQPAPIRSSDHSNLGVPREEAEKLLSGAITSPSAGALLPSGLLADDAEDPPDYIAEDEAQQRDGHSDARNRSQQNSIVYLSRNAMQSNDILPGLGNLPGLGSIEGHSSSVNIPTSPGSYISRSPSLVSSPHESMTNIHHYQPRHSVAFMDSDRRSIRSTSSASRHQRGPSRFAEFLNFRQRGKTMSIEGPALGSLKASQSQSMPRQTELDHTSLETLENSRRKAATSSGFLGHISNALSRKNTSTSKDSDSAQNDTVEPDGIGLFGAFANGDNIWLRGARGLARPRSPSSTYSADNPLRPSSDGQLLGWPLDSALHKSSLLTSLPPANPWSANPSRRQSIHHNESTDLLHGIPDDDGESQNRDHSLAGRSPPQAPIGSKPKDTRGFLPVKQLNPNARTFEIMSMFKKREKLVANGDDITISADESSPPESRKSKDDRPHSATDSFEDYGETNSDGGRTTPSEITPQTTPSGKESFIRKITRKGSSNKVNLPFFKDKSTRRGMEIEGAQDETWDENGTSATLGRSIDSITSSPQVTSSNRSSVLSWSSFRKRPKKGNETLSIDEASQASETGDEEDEE